jgi:hypothetical protein
MNGASNPWVDRLHGLERMDRIKARVRVDAKPIEGLMSLPCESAVVLLSNELKRVFYPTDQACELLRMHVARAQAFAGLRYPARMSFLSDVESEEDILAAGSCWCLTGWAGVGKSELMKALERLMPAPEVLSVNSQYPAQPAFSLRRIAVNISVRETEVLRRLGNPAVFDVRQRVDLPALVAHVRTWFLRTGVVTLVGDELQFVTQSSDANTRVAQLLQTLSILGVPFTYVANFSLGHRLKKRPQEGRQRLLANYQLLMPDGAESECWQGVVKTCLDAAPGAFGLSALEHSVELHRLTAGLKRVLRQLLEAAFRIAHSRSHQRCVTIDDIRVAYHSAAFATNREDVEALIALPHSPSIRRARLDLVCPFPLEDARAVAGFPKSVVRDKQVARAVLHGALSRDERAAGKAIATAAVVAESAGGNASTKQKVVRLPNRPLTVADLLRGSEVADRRRKVGVPPEPQQ